MEMLRTKLVSNAAAADGSPQPTTAPNPKRVAAGKLNWLKRRGLSANGRKKLRLAALRTRPWLHSSGPKSPEGKAKVALNGKRLQLGCVSVRELKADIRDFRVMILEMQEARRSLGL